MSLKIGKSYVHCYIKRINSGLSKYFIYNDYCHIIIIITIIEMSHRSNVDDGCPSQSNDDVSDVSGVSAA